MALDVQICRVKWYWHSANSLFAECYTWQSLKNYFFVFCFHSCKSKIYLTYHTFISHITQISHITHISHICHISHTYLTIQHHRSTNIITSTTKVPPKSISPSSTAAVHARSTYPNPTEVCPHELVNSMSLIDSAQRRRYCMCDTGFMFASVF
jgi:hypothetical protein